MRTENFSGVAEELMQQGLFKDCREGGIGWSADMIEMYLRCEGKCVYCGRDMLKNYIIMEFDAQPDHLLPKSKYGELKDAPSNRVLSCSACNKLKLCRNPNEYGEPLYEKDSGKALSPEDQQKLVMRFVEWKAAYAKRYEETFAKQKEILLGILAGTERAKAASQD